MFLCPSFSKKWGLTHPTQVSPLTPICSASLAMVEHSGVPTRQRCWARAVCWPAFSTTTGLTPVVANSSFHMNTGVSNAPKHLEVQGIKRYSIAVRLPTLSHLTYPSARHKLACRLDPVCGLQVGWSPDLCSSNTAVPITQHMERRKLREKWDCLERLRTYSPLFFALLEVALLTSSSKHS